MSPLLQASVLNSVKNHCIYIKQFLSIPHFLPRTLHLFLLTSLFSPLSQHTPRMPIIMGTASRSSNDHRPHVTVAFIISLIIFLLLPLTSAGIIKFFFPTYASVIYSCFFFFFWVLMIWVVLFLIFRWKG